MAQDTCSIIDCPRPAVARGWCSSHWKKWKRHGDPEWTPPTTEERFFSRVDKDGSVPAYAPHLGPCWLWIGGNSGRYGLFSVGRKTVGAHRWSYENANGPIPVGLEIDHLCRVTLCVNPDHLEPVTPAVNKQRAPNPESAKTHCPKGHPYDDANTWRNARGHRFCRACAREKARKRNAAKPPKAPQTHCYMGHEYTPENTYVYPNGARSCRICRRLQRRQGPGSASHLPV